MVDSEQVREQTGCGSSDRCRQHGNLQHRYRRVTFCNVRRRVAALTHQCKSSICRIPLPINRFWDKMANYAGFLDRRIHTLDHVRRHSTLLTSIILHTAARHTSTLVLPGAARLASALDRHIYSNLWPRVLLGNHKSVYICQACMIWATFVAEPKPGEDDLGWSLFGHASMCPSV